MGQWANGVLGQRGVANGVLPSHSDVVSGFQVAGFGHVIGCLWPSVDRVCVEVARGFYSSLFHQGGIRGDNRDVAIALHEGVKRVWVSDLKQPLNWAQFLHYGA
jgi:hypothetical protein